MVRKAIIPAAGLGTRFLPATKSQPKEMLPIVDKPVIQYVVEEAVASGITDILMVIGKGKRAIEEHFDRSFELENELSRKGRQAELDMIRNVSNLADIHFIWQKELKGLGDAVLCGRLHVGNEPFAVLLGDTLIDSPEPVTRQMIRVFDRYQESVVALEQVPRSRVSRYGIISGREIDRRLYLIDDLVEKPSPEEAPSDLAIAGRYVLTPEIFQYLQETPRGKNDEVQLTDAMRSLVQARAMYGLQFEGRRHDIGNRLEFVKTNLLYALKRPDMEQDVKAFLKDLTGTPAGT
jgi:UTP--glucose-1-phosphate uridylyltransferase